MSFTTTAPRQRVQNLYRQPTLDELLSLCVDFGLVSDISRDGHQLHLTCKDEYFEIGIREAEYLVKGLLLGYFAMHTRDDLGLANWEN